jgi:hypothetical protein
LGYWQQAQPLSQQSGVHPPPQQDWAQLAGQQAAQQSTLALGVAVWPKVVRASIRLTDSNANVRFIDQSP